MRDRAMPGGLTPAVWTQKVAPATLDERRAMKKAAQPEHSYTGHVPKWLQEPEDATPMQERKRDAPILGYSGHLRHREDRIGTTFTKSVVVSRQPQPAHSGPLTKHPLGNSNQQRAAQSPGKKQVKFQEPRGGISKASGYGAFDGASGYGAFQANPNSASSGYGAFDNASGYGQFKGRPKSSGYGAFDNVSGYGQFQTRPQSTGSGYGAFDGASGYGQFQAKPGSGGSGYGAFDGASGYGQFQAKPGSGGSGYGAFDGASGYGQFQAKPGSGGSGYGAFDGASGYGQFQAKPGSGGSGYGAFDGASGYGEFQAKPMSPRSGYGAFENASGYGEFAARPQMSARSAYGAFDVGSGYGDFQAQPMSPRSGYGAFDAASGYGDFVEKPEVEEEADGASQAYGDFAGSVQYGDFMSPRSEYGAFGGASGYEEFMLRPASPVVKSNNRIVVHKPIIMKQNEELNRQYQQALRAIGGEPGVRRLLDAFATTISQRYVKRTELLQALKRHFEKHERENRGQMSKHHVKEALLGLSCVFTDDQLTALMSKYDPECRGTVPMDRILTELSVRATK